MLGTAKQMADFHSGSLHCLSEEFVDIRLYSCLSFVNGRKITSWCRLEVFFAVQVLVSLGLSLSGAS